MIELNKSSIQANNSIFLLNVQNEKKRKSLDLLENYLKLLIEFEKVDKEKKEFNFPVFPGKVKNFKYEEDLIELNANFIQDFGVALKKIEYKSFHLINNLENIVLHVEEGLADEKLFLKGVGAHFFLLIEDYYLEISLLNHWQIRSDNSENAIVTFYKKWHTKIDGRSSLIQESNSNNESQMAELYKEIEKNVLKV